MNIYDISKKAGVSIATVSRVMNGSDKVSEKTRQKILDIMKETGYTPNAFARGLTFNTMKTIGLLCADCSDHFLATAISYLEKGFRANGYDCILCCTGYELKTKQSYLKLLLSKKVDANAGIKLSEKQTLCYHGSINETKNMLINYYDKDFKFDSVVAGDDELAVSAHKFARAKGYTIPDDFSIIGYNNSKVGVCCDPELSTLDNQLEAVCKNTVQSVMDIFDGREVSAKTLVSAQFIQRGTTNF